MNDGISKETKEKILGILEVLFPGAKIYLYGSRARGKYQEKSDIDLIIDAGKKIYVGEAKAMLEASMIPLKIDLVDYHSISQEFKETIMKDAKPWNL